MYPIDDGASVYPRDARKPPTVSDVSDEAVVGGASVLRRALVQKRGGKLGWEGVVIARLATVFTNVLSPKMIQ